MENKEQKKKKVSLMERVGHKIPDPVVIFMILFAILFLI